MVRAGLWEKDVQLLPYHYIDWHEVYRLAIEQSVLGLLLAGLEHSDIKPPQGLLLQWIGEVQQIEQRNKAMNSFVAKLIERLRKEDVHCLLVKGQGVAQCYEKPLWRESGDIDLLLSEESYKKAKSVLTPSASEVAIEDIATKHQSLLINGFDVELHGAMPFILSKRADRVIEKTLTSALCQGGEITLQLDDVDVPLPNPNNHLFIIFTHFLHHFFIEGVGLRQICDWCRMLWSYRSGLDLRILEQRIKRMGLMSEWKVFAALAVDRLGMPVEAMPLINQNDNHSADFSWWDKWRAKRVLDRIMKSGNFGHNNDLSYRTRYTGASYKIVAAWRRLLDFTSLVPVFPLDAPRFFFTYMFNKV